MSRPALKSTTLARSLLGLHSISAAILAGSVLAVLLGAPAPGFWALLLPCMFWQTAVLAVAAYDRAVPAAKRVSMAQRDNGQEAAAADSRKQREFHA